jgi:hypothetical protein
MRGTIKNSGCVSNSIREGLRNRGKSNVQESFQTGESIIDDTYVKRIDGTCWRIEDGYKTVRIKKALYEQMKAQHANK